MVGAASSTNLILSALREKILTERERNKKNTTAAVILYRKEIVALASNDVTKTHPLQGRFGRTPDAIYLHAEIAALAKFLRRRDVGDLSKSTLYIARLKANGDWGNAKPCPGCARAIRAFGIKEIIYT